MSIVPVRQPGSDADGGVSSKQVAEVTLPRAELDRLWSAEHLEDLARTYWRFLSRISLGVLRVLYTDIARDGTLTGVGVETVGAVADAVTLPVIASGGVATVEDLRGLKARPGRPIAGAVLGRALYEERFTAAEALAAVT